MYNLTMSNKEKFLTVEELIIKAKELGVNFGPGEPYNRLRYYTKMGWLPHMTRKGKNVKGHYEEWVLDRLKLIENLRKSGLKKEKITQEIKNLEKKQKIQKTLSSPKNKKIIALTTLIIILLLLSLNEIGVLKIGKTRKDIIPLRQSKTAIFP